MSFFFVLSLEIIIDLLVVLSELEAKYGIDFLFLFFY